MKLSARLQKISNYIGKNSIVGDIGTDHAYIPVYLIEKGISKFVIASDISQGSLEKTIDYVKSKGLEERIHIRKGDGLEVIKPFEVDTLVIAGMGGHLIRDILDKNKQVTDSIIHFVLQPMVASDDLRRYLLNNKFKIIDEDLAQEGDKFYEIIFASKGLDQYEKDIDYEISPRLIEKNHPLLGPFIKKRQALFKGILEKLKDTKSPKGIEKGKEIEKKLALYEEVEKLLESRRNH